MTSRPGDAPPVFVVSAGHCGSTLLSDMLRLHPAILSLSELLVTVLPDAFPGGPIGGERFWALLSTPRSRWMHMIRLDIAIEEILYRPGARAGSARKAASHRCSW